MTKDKMVWWHHCQWTWVWVNSRNWWWTGKPGVLQSIGSQRVGHDWVTELNWTDYKFYLFLIDWFTILVWFLSYINMNQPLFVLSLPGCSLEGLILKLKLQYFGHLMRRVDSLEKTLMLGGIGAGGEGDNRGWDGWMASPTWWTWV